MSEQSKRKSVPEATEENKEPSKEESEYEQGREEALEEAEDNRIIEHDEVVEERLREHEVKDGHTHTPYFGYDNPTYEVKKTFKIVSQDDEKKHKRGKK